ncbi:MAG: P-loop containing nucleoside triphosphate hydrolase protein [Benniella sp.]|nr:MAG: P-loop containing nucleoside triphosphate hydrolase protein [Benniella sp.]
MKLKAELLRGIYASGFKRPSTIQQRAIQPILGNHDVIVQAQSGTDRIAAFTMAILQKLDTSNKQCQALILVPTHDLAQQIQEVIQALGSFMKVQCHICVGGTSIKDDMDRLRRGSQIVVGTLGRVMDMVKRKVFKTDSIRMVVMDEVDEMLSKTLRDQIDHAFEQVLPSTQIVFLSATMPQTALKVASKLLHEPIHIVVKPDELPQGDIKQFYVAVRGDERKLATLCSLCETITASHIVIFCNIHSKVKWLKEKLIAKKLTVSAIHSNMQDIQREAVMEAFSSGSSRVLIMTDFLAYSVDVQHASLVINYDMPPIKENYRRRVSLVGRFGRKGVAISLASDNDVRMLRKIEQLYSMRVAEMSVENPV